MPALVAVRAPINDCVQNQIPSAIAVSAIRSTNLGSRRTAGNSAFADASSRFTWFARPRVARFYQPLVPARLAR